MTQLPEIYVTKLPEQLPEIPPDGIVGRTLYPARRLKTGLTVRFFP